VLDKLPVPAAPANAGQNTRHTVTAIIVAHDGARMLPGLVRALQEQTFPVEQTVGVDTASRDRGGAVLADLLGHDGVFGMPRATGYGEAVAVALRHAARTKPVSADQDQARTEWVWLLHDDCEPAPDTLERLLWAAARDRTVAVAGPKVLDGQDRRTLREVGVSIDRAGRRVTGIDPGEIDQGQHDHKLDVLAVGSAGMLVRRDVWDRLGGFDPSLKLFRDDVDFCWRAQAAGFRVQVITNAVLYHRELAGRRRRAAGVGNARRLDRANALYVLAANLPLLTMLWMVGGTVLGSLGRAFYFLLTKQLDLAAAYAYSVVNLLGHPVRLARARRRRKAGLAAGYNAVRLFIPPARTFFRLAERIAGLISNGPAQASGGRHQAADESEEDEQFTDSPSVMRRVIRHPGVQLFTVLLVVALVAERRLLGISPLGGGALVPAWGGAAALWREYLAGFHAVSVGSTASTSPYVAVVAALATVLGGQAWLAVDVLLLGCVPLAGLTAFWCSRWLVSASLARVLLAAAYALLPVATGAVAAGRLGTAVVFILLPLIAVSAGRMLTAAPRQARRAAWAAGLLTALAAAFVPLTWVLGVVLAAGALALRRWLVAIDPLNAAIAAVTPFFVLFPWSLHLLTSPSSFLSEAGLSSAALTTRGLPATALLALSPGGPGLPPVWVTAGLAVALVVLLLPVRLYRPGRVGLVIAGWTTAVAGLLAAVIVSRVSVTPTAGGQPGVGWPGVALALSALGLLLAFAPALELLVLIAANGSGVLTRPASSRGWGDGGNGPVLRVLAGVALAAVASAPLLAGGYWVTSGVRGPVQAVSAQVLPAFVAASASTGDQYRTLILRPSAGGGLEYAVVREQDPTLGEPELGTASAAGTALNQVVAALGAANGADAGDPGQVLGDFGIKYVLLPSPVDSALAGQLDAAIGLTALSKAPTYDLWEVSGTVARVRVVAADGTVTALSSGTVNMSGEQAPASGGTLILAEPSGGWTAKLNGHALRPLAQPVDGWAQGFTLPAGGGTLSITRDNLARQLSLIVELIALLAVCLLALPGKRANPVAEAQALAALREARDGRRAQNAARRAAAPDPADLPGEPLPGDSDVGVGAWPALAEADTGTVPAETGTPAVLLAEAPVEAPVEAPAELPVEFTEEAFPAFLAAEALPVPEGSAEDADAAPAGAWGTPDWETPAWEPAAWEPSAPEPATTEPVTSEPVPSGSAAPEPAAWGSGAWDMAGDWGSSGQASTFGAWAAQPAEEEAESLESWLTGLTGEQPAISATGPQPRHPQESGPQPTFTPAASPTGEQPVASTGAQSAERAPWDTGSWADSPDLTARPARSGAYPDLSSDAARYDALRDFSADPSGSGDFPDPSPATDRYGALRDFSADFGGSGAYPDLPAGSERSGAYRDLSPAAGSSGAYPDLAAEPARSGGFPDLATSGGAASGQPEQSGPQPEAGTGPTAARPAKPHSHRAKHGKPSRWRGNRSGGDGGA
jgi:GT2 family glycosyltransferase